MHICVYLLVHYKAWIDWIQLPSERDGYISFHIWWLALLSLSEWIMKDVASNSPASFAGLKPNEDFIVGSPGKIFSEEAEFYELVEGYLG